MRKRSRLLAPLLFGGVLLGCPGSEQYQSHDDGVIPAGAIPAAPDVRPGARPTTPSTPAAVPAGAMDTSAAAAPAPAAAPDTAR